MMVRHLLSTLPSPSFIQVDAEDSKTAVRCHAPVTIASVEWLALCLRPQDSDTRLSERFSAENTLARSVAAFLNQGE
jgi:hypothetical protein